MRPGEELVEIVRWPHTMEQMRLETAALFAGWRMVEDNIAESTCCVELK